MSLQPHFPPFGFLCPTTQLAVSGEGTSRNSFQITGEKGDLESYASTLWSKNIGLGSTRSRWSPASCLSPICCHVTEASSGPKTVLFHSKKPTCTRRRQGMCATRSFPPCRHVFIVSTQFCYPGALWYFLQSSPPTNSELQSHLPGSMVSAELCQSWWCHHSNTSVLHKIQKTKPKQQENFPIVPLVLKFSDLFKATSKYGCISLDFLYRYHNIKIIIRDVLERS